MKGIGEVWQAYRLRRGGTDANLTQNAANAFQPSPLLVGVGALSGIAISLLIGLRAQDYDLRFLAFTIIGVVALRFAVDHVKRKRIARLAGWPGRAITIMFESVAGLYACLVGLLAFLTVTHAQSGAMHILSVTFAVAHGSAVAIRNGGCLRTAIVQSVLSILPAAVGLWIHGGLEYRLLAVVLIFFMLCLGEYSASTYRIVVKALLGEREKSQLASKFERLARFDSLTGVENRMAMQLRLREIFEKNHMGNDAVAILWMDLDRFKEINDSIGHLIGDQLLCVVAETLSEALDGRGYVARFGGDEFILVCPGVSRAGAQSIAADVLSHFRQSFEISGHTLSVTASLGIAVAPQDGRDSDELLQHADMALYQAKGNGRNRAVSFTWSMKERFNRLHDIETGIRTALRDRELALHFQPIFDLKSGKVVACEALLRWTHPMLGSIAPKELIPIAENIGVIAEISEWVLSEACAAALEWPEHIRVSVNMSPALFQSADLPRMVVSHLMATGLPARRLELEVTESVLLADEPRISTMLLALQKIGLRLTLDDFGTGYSSLSYLSAYAFDTIKVDESFMRNVNTSAETQAVIRAIIFLAAELGMETVAEGIESEDQLAYATGTGFNSAQGFLLCQPLSQAEINRMLSQDFDMETRRRSQTGQALRKRA